LVDEVLGQRTRAIPDVVRVVDHELVFDDEELAEAVLGA
jgi:hypothetical protein